MRQSSHVLGEMPTVFQVFVKRPEPIQHAEDCAKMHCFEQPEQSQCRGLCRRQREIHNVEQIQLRASGAYRSPLRVNDFETKRAIADREKPPPTKCTFRACKEADMRNHFKDYGIIESQSNPYHTPPEGNESGLLESHGPLLLPLPMRRSALRPHRRPTALGHFL
ncbi:unnamed protein product [Durusdinium trenchii]|uniref:BTB and MATH domain-containing protein 40 n=2 Tax=Durusdinium trenchii TaxID=1381693 RepID=A0ABP0N4U4_9DINO